MSNRKQSSQTLDDHLRELNLSTIRGCYPLEAEKAVSDGLSYEQFLFELAARECESRAQKRIARRLRESRLPMEKTLSSFELQRLPKPVHMRVTSLLDGYFLDNCENVLAFGNPGSGKTHLLCGIAQELIRTQSRRLHFTTCAFLVQELLRAKRELMLRQLLKKLSKFEALIIDDIGYVQQSREEMEVLFTLLAERYESQSVMLTSNLPFSKWEQIFKDPMTTAAAIDRLVHHRVILELNVPSYRYEQALSNQKP